MSIRQTLTLCLLLCSVFAAFKSITSSKTRRVGEIDINAYREKVRRMFYHAYEGYLTHAYPYDELQPLTCAGHDTWGSYSLTLIDAMDTLVVMGNYSEFRRIAHILIDKGESFFDIDINVSVFETNIRIVGGLLSAHLMMKRAGMILEPSWPCNGPLLRMADNIARKILPAFDTATGMPYGTVNLRYGVPKGETTVTCTAGIGTFIIEFGTLSRLTGDPIYEKTAIRAIRALWKYRSPLGLLGNHIDVSNGKWTAQDSGIGGGIDSYFEYLVKGAVMFNIPELLHMFREYEVSVKKYLKRDDWYMWAQMSKGTITLPLFTSLDGYWPSIKGMLGDIDEAMKTMHNFHQVWRQFGFTPEYYNIPKADVHGGREGYPLRPEIVESAMYLYRATKDPYLLEIGVDIVEAIEHSARTSCGYATVKDVRDHHLEDRMESFFLAETTKYLYLLFDPDNFIHNNGSYGDFIRTTSGTCVIEAGGYVFNTEAHPIDLAAVHCCSAAKKEEDQLLQEFHDNVDLLSLLDIVDDSDSDWIEAETKKQRRKKKATTKEEDTVSSVHIQTEEKKYDRSHVDTGVCEVDGENRDEGHFKMSDSIFDDFRTKEEGEASEHEQTKKKHHLHVIDMASFTEAERNLTRIFMEELQMDFIMKNISAQIADRLKKQFKDTEYERLALDTARKILEAGHGNNIDNSTDKSGDKLSDKNNTNDQAGDTSSDKDNKNIQSGDTFPGKDNKNIQSEDRFSDKDNKNIQSGKSFTSIHEENHVSESERSINKDTETNDESNTSVTDDNKNVNPVSTLETSDNDKSQVEISDKNKGISSVEPSLKITITRSDGTQQVILQQISDQSGPNTVILQADDMKEEDTHTGSKAPSITVDAQADPVTTVVSKTVERFKSHLQHQIQQLDNLQQQDATEPLSSEPSASGPSSSLENKRTNLLSITTKILKLFTRDVTSDSKDSNESGRIPSLGGLYTTLANYPLKYFHDPSAMHCPAQPFHSRISVHGEMFPDE